MVATRQYFSNAAGSVDFVPGAYVYLHWSGEPMTGPEFRALYIHARNLLLRHELHAILADHRAMPAAPTDADREWLLTEWLPQTVAQTSYDCCAVLQTLDPAHRLHTDPVVRDLRRYVTAALFDDLEEAAAWLGAHCQA